MSSDPEKRAKAVVSSVTHYTDFDLIAKLSEDLGDPMDSIDLNTLADKDRMADRGW